MSKAKAKVLAQEYAPEVPIEKLAPHPENPRQGDLDLIEESIAENGFYGAVVAQRSTGYILAGNHRWKAAKAEGLKAIPVFYLDVDDAAARRILSVDNRSADVSGYEHEALSPLLYRTA